MMSQAHPYDELSRWRLAGGIVFLVLAILLPLSSVWVAFLPLSTAAKAAIIAILLLGAPEVCALIAVVIMGKPAYNALKRMVEDWTRAKSFETPNNKNKTLHRS
jgi:hypothetical protein